MRATEPGKTMKEIYSILCVTQDTKFTFVTFDGKSTWSIKIPKS
jgi:hypothetical protein